MSSSSTSGTIAEIVTPTMKIDPSGLGVFELVRRDHQIVAELFEMYKNSSSIDQKQLIVYHTIRELSQHSCAEETTWYLKLEDKLGSKGKQYLDESIKEHQQLKEDLEVVNTTKITEARGEQKFENVIKDVLQHVKFEESSVLPDMEASMTSEELASLKDQWLKAKSMATTRPHPSAGTPAPSVASHATSLIDKTADLVRFGTEKVKAYASEPSAAK